MNLSKIKIYWNYWKVMRMLMILVVLCLFTNITPAFSAPPSFDNTWGVSTFYNGTDSNVFFVVWVKDWDGVTPTSHTVTVTHPGGSPTETLSWWESLNLTYASNDRALFMLSYQTDSVANGDYVFTVNDGSSDPVTFTESFTSEPLLAVPTLYAPYYFIDDDDDAAVGFSWSPVAGAVAYQVRVAVRYGQNFDEMRPMYTYWVWDGDTSAAIPDNSLAPGCDYIYYVNAFREDPRYVGFFGLNNASRSQDFAFTRPGTGYDSTLSYFTVRHRTHEGDDWKADYNQLLFGLESEPGINAPQDILKTIQLFDPNNNPVSISGFGYWRDEYTWRNGVYDENEGIWNYNNDPKHETSYGGIIYDALIDGTYRLELTDAYGKSLTEYFTFTNLPQPLPIIPSDSFECRPDIWNNIHCEWEISEGSIFPEGAYFRSRVDGGFTEYDETPIATMKETWLQISMSSPTSFNQSFVPSHVAETLFTIDDPPLEGIGGPLQYLNAGLDVRTANSDHRARTRSIDLGNLGSFFDVNNGGGGSEALPIDEDSDGDGIFFKVDVSGGVRIDETVSDDFSDGPTSGTITDRALLSFDIKDVNYPEGVSVVVTGAGDGKIEACGDSTAITLNDGDDIVVTCGSAIIKVLNGEVMAEFFEPPENPGEEPQLVATATLNGDATSDVENTIIFEPETGTFSVPASNTVPVETQFFNDVGEPVATVELVGDPENENDTSITFEPETGTFTVPETNPMPVEVILYDGTELSLKPGDEFMPVDINIRPFSRRNIIVLWHWGFFPVAILSNPEFDAPYDVERTSITFGQMGDEDSLVFCRNRTRDVNGDGMKDLTCLFRTRDTEFEVGDTVGILKCETVDGMSIQGSDSVHIISW